MTRSRVTAKLRRSLIVEFGGRCAYCHTMTAITGARLVIDHIVPEAHGGPTESANLCLACHSCNEFKSSLVEGLDSDSGLNAPLFHPRRDSWPDHFRWSADFGEIIGRTAIGRATVAALNMNHLDIVEARRRWALVGWHPPIADL